ncbi:YihY/virulence factor BrkB family protein [Nibrella saemangeumensis]|uniref:YihY/virulence factor BrkB family protein n=1 Tax=Nibrella saemangeumensis TaxID=1084526 RepID=A0ABP8MUR8_9BACT
MNKPSLTDAFKTLWSILQATFSGFSNDRVMKLSAALAYYTVFSLSPLLLLVISMVSLLYGDQAIEGKIFHQINEFMGDEAALQLQEMIKNVKLSGQTTTAVVTGGIALLAGATSVFIEIQDSINLIWRVKPKPRRGWLKLLKDRLRSFSLIISLGFLLLVSLIINGLVAALSGLLSQYFPQVTIWVVNLLNLVISFGVTMLLFGIIFKFLPDVKIAWKDVQWGAFFTALLFMGGRYLIALYIETTGTASAFGAAGSIVIILVWIYYSAVLLYLGAEFTRAYAEHHGLRIRPADYAVYVEVREIERDIRVLPPQNTYSGQ